MEKQTMEWLIQGLRYMITVGSFAFLMLIACTCQPQKVLLRAYEEIGRNLKEGRNSLWDYRKQQDFLKKYGADFHFGRWISPISYMAIKLIAGGLGFMLGSRYQIWIAVIPGVIMFRLPDLMLFWLNRRDNELMLPELKLVYNAISMQMKAGVHVTDALSECYISVHDARLREAFYALSGDIVMNADVEDALERLQNKFDNRYIDALCITIVQALESGQAVELLADISDQMKDMEAAIINRKKSSLDRSITFYQLGILTAILVVVLYACVVHMMSAVMDF